MKYALIREMDISNGTGIGVSLFVQGCRAHCKNCFNPETWSFNNGKKWSEESKNIFLDLVSRQYVKRVSVLGGEPLEKESLYDVIDLLKDVKNNYPDKTIWLYTGYTIEHVLNCDMKEVLQYVDILVDGRYVEELKDITLPFRGSSNQRVIDVQETLQKGEIVLYNK